MKGPRISKSPGIHTKVKFSSYFAWKKFILSLQNSSQIWYFWSPPNVTVCTLLILWICMPIFSPIWPECTIKASYWRLSVNWVPFSVVTANYMYTCIICIAKSKIISKTIFSNVILPQIWQRRCFAVMRIITNHYLSCHILGLKVQCKDQGTVEFC